MNEFINILMKIGFEHSYEITKDFECLHVLSVIHNTNNYKIYIKRQIGEYEFCWIPSLTTYPTIISDNDRHVWQYVKKEYDVNVDINWVKDWVKDFIRDKNLNSLLND